MYEARRPRDVTLVLVLFTTEEKGILKDAVKHNETARRELTPPTRSLRFVDYFLSHSVEERKDPIHKQSHVHTPVHVQYGANECRTKHDITSIRPEGRAASGQADQCVTSRDPMHVLEITRAGQQRSPSRRLSLVDPETIWLRCVRRVVYRCERSTSLRIIAVCTPRIIPYSTIPKRARRELHPRATSLFTRRRSKG